MSGAGNLIPCRRHLRSASSLLPPGTFGPRGLRRGIALGGPRMSSGRRQAARTPKGFAKISRSQVSFSNQPASGRVGLSKFLRELSCRLSQIWQWTNPQAEMHPASPPRFQVLYCRSRLRPANSGLFWGPPGSERDFPNLHTCKAGFLEAGGKVLSLTPLQTNEEGNVRRKWTVRVIRSTKKTSTISSGTSRTPGSFLVTSACPRR